MSVKPESSSALPASTERLPLRQISTTGRWMLEIFFTWPDEVGIHLPVRKLVPRDVVRAHRMADEQVFHLAAAVDHHCVGMVLDVFEGFFRRQVLHGDAFSGRESWNGTLPPIDGAAQRRRKRRSASGPVAPGPAS